MVRVDGQVILDGPQAVLVSNNPYETGDIAGLGRRARLDQGVLGVVGVKIANAAQAAGLLRRAQRSRSVTVLTAREVVIDADQPHIPVGIDGESVLMPTPVRCTIRPLALRVHVPRHRPGVPEPLPPWTGRGCASRPSPLPGPRRRNADARRTEPDRGRRSSMNTARRWPRRPAGATATGRRSRHSRIVQICEAVLLALVTITAAWAGYSAARWGTESRVEIAKSSTLRALASRDDLTALSQRNFDASTFNAWFTAFTLNSPQKEAIAMRRFRPPFRVAFNAWMATNPLHNPHAPPGPTYMPQYKLPAQAKANALDTAATRSSARQQPAHVPATTTSGSRCSWPPCCSWSASAARSSCRHPLRPDHLRLGAAHSLDRADPAAAGAAG